LAGASSTFDAVSAQARLKTRLYNAFVRCARVEARAQARLKTRLYDAFAFRARREKVGTIDP